MLCDECGQNQATIHIATIIGDKKKDENLCPQCWQKRNAALLGGLKVNDLLSQLLGAKHEKEQESEEKIELVCDQCGMSYQEFQKSGKVGCAHCYAAFGEHMEKTLKSIHGHARHVGKVPERLEGELNARRALDDLRRQMEAAVAEENFEQAAVLRDRIREVAMQEAVLGKAPEVEEDE